VSARGLAVTAGVIAALYGGAHALGLRAYTAILSGTAPPGGDGAAGVVLGLVYVALYFACVVGAPILAIAAAVMWGLSRRRP
jgi:hypothetical protein